MVPGRHVQLNIVGSFYTLGHITRLIELGELTENQLARVVVAAQNDETVEN